jgi:hypothetical protein
MIKIVALALTIATASLASSFAGTCNGGGCSKGDKPAPTATPAP